MDIKEENRLFAKSEAYKEMLDIYELLNEFIIKYREQVCLMFTCAIVVDENLIPFFELTNAEGLAKVKNAKKSQTKE